MVMGDPREGGGIMVIANKPDAAPSPFVTREEGWEILDELARRYLHMSAEAFVRAWNAGAIEHPDRPEVLRVAMLLPLAR